MAIAEKVSENNEVSLNEEIEAANAVFSVSCPSNEYSIKPAYPENYRRAIVDIL